MSRFLHQAVSSLTVIGYLLVITMGPLWHDHRHCHSHPHGGEAGCCADAVVEHSHPHCCGHHHHDHANCGQEAREQTPATQSSPSPCHSPLHDDSCPICQVLAHPPLSAPAIVVVDVSAPVEEFAPAALPHVERIIPAAYDSRGPPMA